MKHRRHGTTLVETLLVCALATFVLSAVAVSLYGVRSTYQHTRQGWLRQSAIHRLAEQLRRDAHNADTATLDGTDLVFTYSNTNTIRYQQLDCSIERVVHQDDQRIHRDAIHLPDVGQVRFQVSAEASTRVTVIVPIEAKKAESAVEYRVETHVGWLVADLINDESEVTQ